MALLLLLCYFAFAVFVGKVIALGNRPLLPYPLDPQSPLQPVLSD